jgi:hypothetical protein
MVPLLVFLSVEIIKRDVCGILIPQVNIMCTRPLCNEVSLYTNVLITSLSYKWEGKCSVYLKTQQRIYCVHFFNIEISAS